VLRQIANIGVAPRLSAAAPVEAVERWRRATAETGPAAGLAARLYVSVAMDPGHASRPKHPLLATALSWYAGTSK
jgi:hypothetical protein